MEDELEPGITFASGVVESASTARVICQIADGGSVVSAIARWNGPGSKWSLFPMKWEPVRLAFVVQPKPCLFALAGNGTVGMGYGSYTEEQIDPSNEGPKGRGPLRDLRVVGSTLFVAGIARQVYRRSDAGRWERFDNGTVSPLGETRPLGFTSIDGVSERELWAVGYGGEIWSCSDGLWTQHESPTNLLLHRIRVISSGEAYACGQKGLVLHLKSGSWDQVAIAADVSNLWGMEYFAGKLYVSSEHGIYRLQGDMLENVPVPGASTFAHLHASDGVLWSFGLRDLAWTTNGVDWNRVSPLQ